MIAEISEIIQDDGRLSSEEKDLLVGALKGNVKLNKTQIDVNFSIIQDLFVKGALDWNLYCIAAVKLVGNDPRILKFSTAQQEILMKRIENGASEKETGPIFDLNNDASVPFYEDPMFWGTFGLTNIALGGIQKGIALFTAGGQKTA